MQVLDHDDAFAGTQPCDGTGGELELHALQSPVASLLREPSTRQFGWSVRRVNQLNEFEIVAIIEPGGDFRFTSP
jgi:hypothetical protein